MMYKLSPPRHQHICALIFIAIGTKLYKVKSRELYLAVFLLSASAATEPEVVVATDLYERAQSVWASEVPYQAFITLPWHHCGTIEPLSINPTGSRWAGIALAVNARNIIALTL